MNIQEYIIHKKKLYKTLLNLIENEENVEDNFQNVINLIKSQKIAQNREELYETLYLLLLISNNHFRNTGFFNKIDQILNYLKDAIKKTFSNSEIFNLFESNMRVLLFLIKNNFIALEESIVNKILSNGPKYCHFFYPEIQKHIDTKTSEHIKKELLKINEKIFDNFDENRMKGENDSPICELIRKDSIKEFSDYVSQNRVSLSSKIKPSIFETNSFLIENEPSLLEYSAFVGSVNVFKDIRLNGFELTPSLWPYAIHGQNAEIINLLVENHIEPEDKNYDLIFKEVIKCHHNEIAEIILKHFSHKEKNDFIKYCFEFHDYSYFPDDLNNKSHFYLICEFNYITLVKLFMETNRSILNSKEITINLCLNGI